MNKSMFVGALFGAVVVTAGATLAGVNFFDARKGEPATDDSSAQTAPDPAPTAVLPAAKPAATARRKAPKPVSQEPAFAEVVNVTPSMATVQTPRQVCHDVVVTHTAPPTDKYRIAGTAAGAALGGLVGNQFGGGDFNKVLTAAGVVAGGYAGNRTQQRMQAGNTYNTTEQRCETISESHQVPQGFDVTYRLNGSTGTVRMDHDPGSRIPVRNGELVL